MFLAVRRVCVRGGKGIAFGKRQMEVVSTVCCIQAVSWKLFEITETNGNTIYMLQCKCGSKMRLALGLGDTQTHSKMQHRHVLVDVWVGNWPNV